MGSTSCVTIICRPMMGFLVCFLVNIATGLAWPDNCPGGEYGGCEGDRCGDEVCCCWGQDGGCQVYTCPPGTVFRGGIMYNCHECPTWDKPPTDDGLCRPSIHRMSGLL